MVRNSYARCLDSSRNFKKEVRKMKRRIKIRTRRLDIMIDRQAHYRRVDLNSTWGPARVRNREEGACLRLAESLSLPLADLQVGRRYHPTDRRCGLAYSWMCPSLRLSQSARRPKGCDLKTHAATHFAVSEGHCLFSFSMPISC
jgi:hypothetical protein